MLGRELTKVIATKSKSPYITLEEVVYMYYGTHTLSTNLVS